MLEALVVVERVEVLPSVVVEVSFVVVNVSLDVSVLILDVVMWLLVVVVTEYIDDMEEVLHGVVVVLMEDPWEVVEDFPVLIEIVDSVVEVLEWVEDVVLESKVGPWELVELPVVVEETRVPVFVVEDWGTGYVGTL